MAFLCLSLAALSALSMPVAIRHVIDHGFSRTGEGTIHAYFLSLLLLAMALAVFSSLRYYCVMWIGERVVADIRTAVYQHVLNLGPTFYEDTRTGEVLSRLTTDTTLVQSVIGAGLSIALRSGFMLTGALIMLFITSSRLTLLLFVLLPVVVVPLWLYGRKVRRLSRITQDKIAESSGIAGEILNAIHIIQAFTQERQQGRRFALSVEASFQAARQRLLVSSVLSGIIVLTAFSAIVIVLWTGAQAVIDGEITPGALGQFLLYATIVAGSSTALGEVWGDVQRAAGAMERLTELLQSQAEITTPTRPIALPVQMAGKLQFDKVSFRYPARKEQRTLCDFSLQVAPGETVALVGPSGAGKSTVFQLLLRFYDPEAGRIMLSDCDIRQVSLQDLRRQIGLVPQQTLLFASSVMENIRMGDSAATDEQVRQAAKAACAREFIESLPAAYQTRLAEKGAGLSAGQQQRIAIARALLKDPPVLLLDEATSSLDAESEHLVQQALQRLMCGRTVIVIAHRLATVKQADRIIVMQQGRIVDEGKHEVLVARQGLYARLAKLQFN